MAPAAYKDLCLDAVDPLRLGTFWAAVLGLELADAGEGTRSCAARRREHTVWINAVPEPKTVKNRMHLDVHARSVDELLALGATVLDEQPRWTVMADPEGPVELCAFVRKSRRRTGCTRWASTRPTRGRSAGGGPRPAGCAAGEAPRRNVG